MEWQTVVFAERPRRIDLARLAPERVLAPLAVRVHRNHTIEHAMSPLRTFLAYGGWDATITAGPYDDALLASARDGSRDVEVVWLDFERYREAQRPEALAAWLADRVAGLRAETAAAIVVTDAPGDDAWAADLRAAIGRLLAPIPGVGIAAVSAIAAELGAEYRDTRARSITGAGLGDAAAIGIARLLGFIAIPPLLRPRLKVLALDLDETLYAGVLGEDGPAGIRVTPDHAALHARIRDVAASGVLLALVSRNEPEDVQALFRERPDLGLRWDEFAARAIGWGHKSDAIARIAGTLRVGVDAVLFVDDNPGELAEVVAATPGIKVLHAQDPRLVTRALATYPGLAGYRTATEDALRAADIAAMSAREAVIGSGASDRDPAAYARELDARLVLRAEPHDLMARLSELSRKTNQMNTAFLRLSEVDVAGRLGHPEHRTVSFALSDRLSDAGVVGAVFCRGAADVLQVEEVVVSCRALGRAVETIAILSAVLHAAEALGCVRVRFAFTPGPRNGPAREWLDTLPAGDRAGSISVADLAVHAEKHRNGFQPRWEES